MKVVHLCLGNFYIDNYSYQENMLPKFHKILGCDCEIIASLMTFDKNGKSAFMENASTYESEYGIKVTRLEFKKPFWIYKKFKKYVGTYDALDSANPDILFIHGCQFMDMKIVVKWLQKHQNVRVYVDNHADFSNSARNFLSKNILHKMIWRHMAHLIEPYTKKFYGVLPARVDFLKNVYTLPAEKCELLVMGVDDEEAKKANMPAIRKKIREQYGISEDDFLIVTGGKIDEFKKQTLLLMDAVNEINSNDVKLIVFGSVINQLKEEVKKRCSDKVKYIGWIGVKDSYKIFSACDFAIFPGRHSVIWEQVVGQGIPMAVKFWDGTTHVDVGGNVRFLYEDSKDEIKKVIEKITEDKEFYNKMKNVAETKGLDMFSYKNIAKKSIEM